MSELDVLVHQSKAAVEVILSGASNQTQRAEAQKFCDSLHEHEASHEIGFRLLTSSNESGRHFGCQLIRSGVRRRWNGWPDDAKTACKRFFLDLSTVNQAQPFVKAKFAEAVVEVVRREWPQRWLDFLPTLLNTGAHDFVLLILRTLAESVAEEQVDLPPNRRKEVRSGLVSNKADIFTFFAKAMSGDPSVALRREGIILARSLTKVLTLRVLLQARIDEFVWAQLANDDLREEALLTLSEWANTKMLQKGTPNMTKEDGFNRLVLSFANLGSYAQFSPNLEDAAYSVHRQISSLIKDFLTENTDVINELPIETQTKLWNTQMQLALYPSVYIACEALAGLRLIVRASKSLEGLPYINVKDIVTMSFIRQYKPEGGPVSQVLHRALPNTQQWIDALSVTWESDYDLWGAPSSHTIVGVTKNAVWTLLRVLIEVGGPEYFEVHVRHSTDIFNELFQEEPKDPAALESAYALTERLGPGLASILEKERTQYERGIQKATTHGKNCTMERPADVLPVVDLALQVLHTLMSLNFGVPETVPAKKSHPKSGNEPTWLKLEVSRLVYVQHSAPLFRFRPEVIGPVLEFLFARIERSTKGCGYLFTQQRQALVCLLGIAKNGNEAVTQHLGALLNKAQAIYPSLGTNQRILLVQSLIAAASSDFQKQVQVIELVLAKDVQAWTSAEMTKLVNSGSDMIALVMAKRTCPAGGDGKLCDAGTALRKSFNHVKSFWDLLHGFTMAIRNSAPEDNNASPFTTRRHPANQLIQAILPNLFSAVETFVTQFDVDWLAPPANGSDSVELSLIARAIDEQQWAAIVGGQKVEEGQGALQAFPCPNEYVKEARGWVWQLRVVLFKALGACIHAADGFWSEQIINRLIKLVGHFKTMCPFHVVCFHRFVFGDLFTTKGAVILQPALLKELTSTLLPVVLSSTIDVCERYYGALDRKDPAVMNYPLPVQNIIATMTVSLMQQLSIFCSTVSLGPKGKICNMAVVNPADHVKKLQEMRGPKNKTLPRPVPSTWLECIILEDKTRLALRQTAFKLMRFPDAVTVSKAIHCLKVIAAQTWSVGVLYFGGFREPGEFDHKLAITCAMEKLADVVENHFRPLLQMLTTQEAVINPESCFASILMKSWADYLSEFMIAGKTTSSPLISDISHCVYIGLMSIIRLYHLQLGVLNLSPPEKHLNQCQPLMTVIQLLVLLPNTSQAEVERVIMGLLDVNVDPEDAKALVRSLLKAAAPDAQRITVNGTEVRDIPSREMEEDRAEEDNAFGWQDL